MINIPNTKDLQELKTFIQPYCVSIYAPLVDPESTTNFNQIELKNLVKQAEVALLESKISDHDLKKTMLPAKKMIYNNRFWSRRHEGLAIYLHSNFFRYYHIPGDQTPYLLTVENGFNLDPLMNILANNQSYLVLALEHNKVQLYEGDRFHFHPVQLKNFPSNMYQALGYSENPKWHETHTIAPSITGKGSEAFHGQYNISQIDKNMLEEFFRTIDRRLHRYLLSSHKPLILAGVSYLIPIYRKVNTYTHLWSLSIKGNVKNEAPNIIHHKAWALIQKGSMQS